DRYHCSADRFGGGLRQRLNCEAFRTDPTIVAQNRLFWRPGNSWLGRSVIVRGSGGMATDATIVDVLVIGGGGSGLAAAITAAEEGRKVLLVEKNLKLGGSTAWSVGSFTASATSDQHRDGIADDAESHFEDMGKFTGKW